LQEVRNPLCLGGSQDFGGELTPGS
jgi:hypothetical protein